MTHRAEIETLLSALYTARVKADLDGVLACFSPDVAFRIVGSSHSRQISIIAVGIAELRPWLAMMLKTFRLLDQEMVSLIIDQQSACAHWRARVVSKITGAEASTEFVDLVRVEGGRIASYSELFVPY